MEKGKWNTQDTRGKLKHTSKKGDYKNFRKRHGIKDKKHFVVQICTKSIMYTWRALSSKMDTFDWIH